MTSHDYGCFREDDARAINHQLVTITTHDDPETDQPGQTHGPLYVLHVATKPYLMLLRDRPRPDRTDDWLDPETIVFLADVATVTTH